MQIVTGSGRPLSTEKNESSAYYSPKQGSFTSNSHAVKQVKFMFNINSSNISEIA